MRSRDLPNPSGKTILFVTGEFAGEQGICLGPAPGEKGLWAVSPHSSDKIMYLRVEKDFGLLVNADQEPGRN